MNINQIDPNDIADVAPPSAAPTSKPVNINDLDSSDIASVEPPQNPHDLLPGLQGMAQGVVDKAKQTGSGLVDAIKHPVNTAKEVGSSLGDLGMMVSGAKSPAPLLDGAYRAVRSVPVLGRAVDSTVADAKALGGDVSDLVSGGQGSGQAAVDEYKNAQSASDAQHEKDHPLTDFLQKGAGLAAGATVAGPKAGIDAAVSQWAPQTASLALDSYMRSKSAGNDNTTALKDARNALVGMGIAGQAAEGLGGMIDMAAPAVNDFAENRAASALGWTKALRKKYGQDAAMDAGRVGLDNKIVTPLASTADKIAGSEDLLDSSGQTIGNTMSTLDSQGIKGFNPLSVGAKVHNQMGDVYQNEPLFESQAGQYDKLLQTIGKRGSQDIPFAEAQKLKQLIGRYGYKEGMAIPGREQAQQAYGIVNSSLDDAVDQGARQLGDDKLLGDLQGARSANIASRRNLEALTGKEAAEQGNGQIGLDDKVLAAADLATNPLKAGAKIVGNHIVKRFGNNLAAVGADKLAEVLNAAPETFGQFAPVLAAAAQRGPAALQATHAMLLKTNPDYAKQLGGGGGN